MLPNDYRIQIKSFVLHNMVNLLSIYKYMYIFKKECYAYIFNMFIYYVIYINIHVEIYENIF